MVDVEAKAHLLRKRVEALSFPDTVLEQASAIISAVGMRLPDAASALRREWLNDMVATTDAAEFRHASRDPSAHFLAWVSERAKNRFHVTYRAVEAAAVRLGPEIAARIIHVVWPQEIAWAQRMRLSENPNIATKAAMFLRESEGNPAKLFGKIADLYGEAVIKAGYSESPAHDLTADEIRFSQTVPEFNPLFLRHAARSYSDVLHAMTRERIELLAARAANDEQRERQAIAAEKAVLATRRFPMRRVLAIVSAAFSFGLDANSLYRLESAFLDSMERGEVDIEQGIVSPHAAFVSMMSDQRRRMELLSTSPSEDFDAMAILWEVANFDRRWLDGLPESYRRWSAVWTQQMEAWQREIVEERRPAPFDPVSDFAFWLMEAEA